MYCRNCGEQIEDDSIFCKYCGKDVTLKEVNITEDFKQDIESEDEVVSAIADSKQHSMKWFKALKRFFIPMWLVLGLLGTIGNTYSNVIRYYNDSWEYFFTNSIDGLSNLLSLVLYFTMMLILLIAYIGILDFKMKGYKFIMIFFILSAIYPVLNMLVYIPAYSNANIEINYGFTIGRFLGSVLFYGANILYFKKRKYLFTGI